MHAEPPGLTRGQCIGDLRVYQECGRVVLEKYSDDSFEPFEPTLEIVKTCLKIDRLPGPRTQAPQTPAALDDLRSPACHEGTR